VTLRYRHGNIDRQREQHGPQNGKLFWFLFLNSRRKKSKWNGTLRHANGTYNYL